MKSRSSMSMLVPQCTANGVRIRCLRVSPSLSIENPSTTLVKSDSRAPGNAGNQRAGATKVEVLTRRPHARSVELQVASLAEARDADSARSDRWYRADPIDCLLQAERMQVETNLPRGPRDFFN